MRYLVLGADGYIGWALSLYLKERGHVVYGVDNFTRRQVGKTAIPIADPATRGKCLEKFWEMCIAQNPNAIRNAIKQSKPDCIVHLAEQPSAPWSMQSLLHCVRTHSNNLVGTLNLLFAMQQHAPEAHLIKLGSMGEYGTKNAVIPEGEFIFNYASGETGSGFFPRHPGSWYHLTKVHDTHNCEFASRLWGLRITDIMQGVVFGLGWGTPAQDELLTRFDYDEYFGTVINRFCAQAASNYPLTVYGSGGQTRGYIPLRDSLRCIELASKNPPADDSRYRTFNQLAKTFSVRELAMAVQEVSGIKIDYLPEVRMEAQEHDYYPVTEGLAALGYTPTINLHEDISNLILTLKPYRSNINPKYFIPTTNWRPTWDETAHTDPESPLT